ncbi:MAG: cupin [Nitrospira sp.]|nr:MAG: cupin [Nitrospira sp.]
MATLRMPDKNMLLADEQAIRLFLDQRGIFYQRWATDTALPSDATDTQVLATCNQWLKPFMEKHGYRTSDVVRVTPHTPNLPAIREKFLREHTHSEDEIRYFVEGQGQFWFHKEGVEDEVFALFCEQGDLVSVPADTKHWFDLGTHPYVCAIRVFTNQAGWVPQYTESGIEQRYR